MSQTVNWTSSEAIDIWWLKADELSFACKESRGTKKRKRGCWSMESPFSQKIIEELIRKEEEQIINELEMLINPN